LHGQHGNGTIATWQELMLGPGSVKQVP
jgi:hypothetical protein